MNNNKEDKGIVNLRRCITCHKKQNKFSMIRIVKTPDKCVYIDPTCKADGRGAYICMNEKCISRALKENRISRALKAELQTDIKEILEKENKQGGLHNGDHH